ncbi:4-hydroxythreonine-4-phosphate dehydrogenase [Fulvitalea axinellae]|uniref:4-hydroxythreonine-4-phosphate dehydrogenase n=1 Tax=Fulvitalea axinellae TaxID=1182444 RepID=A0AAU9D7U9_9BACT|nr:4-hydroxythreonine-4-phosphate dehydrogenase [Fulvitalea axinellae]
MSSHKDTNRSHPPKIGISIGDINGVGPEIVIKALADNRITSQFTPVVYGSSKVLSFYKKKVRRDDFQLHNIKDASHAAQKKVNVINCWEETAEITPGKQTEIGGKCAFTALERAVADLLNGTIDALVTAPINKHNIQSKDFDFPGHTEYLQAKDGKDDCVMTLCDQGLRVGVVTGHMPIAEVPSKITAEALRSKIDIMLASLRLDFGINKPKLAVLGLNPHAGENGILGQEEIDVIKPVIKEYKRKGELVIGPYPADGFFGSSQFRKFDGILAMYHDQGLIPFKALAFETGVNYTSGLSFVRTSPDHGTAYDIAGKGIADETSMREAIYMAIDVVKNRLEAPKPKPKKAPVEERKIAEAMQDESQDFPLEKVEGETIEDVEKKDKRPPRRENKPYRKHDKKNNGNKNQEK